MISYSINDVFNGKLKMESGKWKIVLNNFQFGQGRVQFFAPLTVLHLWLASP